MRRQGSPRLGDRPLIRVQIPLRGGQRAVPCDLPQNVHRDTRISHPGQPGVAQIVPTQVLIAEPDHDVIPMRGVTKDRGADPAAAGLYGFTGRPKVMWPEGQAPLPGWSPTELAEQVFLRLRDTGRELEDVWPSGPPSQQE